MGNNKKRENQVIIVGNIEDEISDGCIEQLCKY